MTITPAVWNLVVYIGGTFQYTFTLQDEAGQVIDLTGYSAELQARNQLSDATPLFSLDSDGNGITITESTGTISFRVEDTVTADLSPNKDAFYDIRITSPSGDIDYILAGNLEIRQMATQ